MLLESYKVKKMTKYIIHNSDGEILRYGQCQEGVSQANDGEFQINVDWTDDVSDYTVQNGILVRKEQAVLDAQVLEKQKINMRSYRDNLLSACDWTQVPDSPLTDAKKAEWATYRQALRDLPSTTTDFANPVWPSQPS